MHMLSLRRAAHSSRSFPKAIQASFLRGGTSKGVFIRRDQLPANRSEWDPIFLRLMGSPDPYGRQLNGMGGGISSLSKIMVVGPPSPGIPETAGVDAEYTFVQIGIEDGAVEYTGNCGNLSSVAGVFAVDAGIARATAIAPEDTQAGNELPLGKVRLWNSNTKKVIETTFPIDAETSQPVLNLPQATIAGVSSKASRIILDFLNPAGAMAPSGLLFPTGIPQENISLLDDAGCAISAQVTLIDCSNPTVILDVQHERTNLGSTTLAQALLTAPLNVMDQLELIRQEGARRMGLDPSSQAQPKVVLISSGKGTTGVDLFARALSMGVPHKALPMTVALGVGVATRVPGTVAFVAASLHSSTGYSELKPSDAQSGFVTIQHPGGHVEVGAKFLEKGQNGAIEPLVSSASVVRTGRWLMRGEVFYD